MVKSVDDLESEFTDAVQELSGLTKEYNSKNLSATPLDVGPEPLMAPEDLTALMERIQEATKRIDELKKKLYGDAPPIVS
jgi:hypothetical protein